MRLASILAIVVLVVLVFTNPNEADFREHVRRETGIAGQFGMVVADLLSGDKQGGINRQNFFIASRFYVGGDGLLPREDVAWGIAGQFIEIDGAEGKTPLGR